MQIDDVVDQTNDVMQECNRHRVTVIVSGIEYTMEHLYQHTLSLTRIVMVNVMHVVK